MESYSLQQIMVEGSRLSDLGSAVPAGDSFKIVLDFSSTCYLRSSSTWNVMSLSCEPRWDCTQAFGCGVSVDKVCQKVGAAGIASHECLKGFQSQPPLEQHADEQVRKDVRGISISGTSGAPMYEDLNDVELDKVVEQALEEFQTPGIAVAVVHGDRTWAKGYGFADLAEQIRVTPETLFFTGSTTKSFTAALTASLIESPRTPAITWQTPLANLIHDDWVLDPVSPAGQWATQHATIEDALSHRTGLPRHELAWTNRFDNMRDIVRKLRHLPVHNTLRAKWEYCNNAYTAVSHAIETTLAKSMKDLLEEHIFEPLEMNSSSYSLEDALGLVKHDDKLNMACGYLWDRESKDFELVPLDDIPPSRGAGGIISHVLDYSIWVKHLMNPSNLNAALSQNAVNAMLTPRMLMERTPKMPFVGPEAYCLGLFSQVYRGREIISHAGAINGYMANMVMVPSVAGTNGEKTAGWAVVTMQNSYSLAQNVVSWFLLDNHLQTPTIERHNMCEVARETQRESEDKMRWESILERLYGGTPTTKIKPALPLSAYEGVYHHPAYFDFKIALSPVSRPLHDRRPPRDASGLLSRDTLQVSESGPPLYLAPSGAKQGYLDLSAILYHVCGEHWWAYQRYGPTSWVTDRALKVQFVVGSAGTVTGMKYQAEPQMPEYLALFEKIE